MQKIVFFSLLLFSLATQASGVAKFTGIDGGKPYSLSLEYLDRATSRIDIEDSSDINNYFLFKNKQVQVVTTYLGNTLVMDMESMGQLAEKFGVMDVLGIDSNTLLVNVIDMTPTGKKETVAGIVGDVYTVTWSRNNVKQTDELVASGDRRAWEYTAAWIDAMNVISQATPSITIKGDELMSRINNKKLGILRFGKRIQLVSVQDRPVSPSRFESPGTSITIPGLGNL